MGVEPSEDAPQRMMSLGDDGKTTGTTVLELAAAVNGAELVTCAPLTTALTTTVPLCVVFAWLETVTYTTLALVAYPTTFNPKLAAPNDAGLVATPSARASATTTQSFLSFP